MSWYALFVLFFFNFWAVEDVYFSHCAIALTGDNARQKCPLLLLLHTDCVYGSFSLTIFVFKKVIPKSSVLLYFCFFSLYKLNKQQLYCWIKQTEKFLTLYHTFKLVLQKENSNKTRIQPQNKNQTITTKPTQGAMTLIWTKMFWFLGLNCGGLKQPIESTTTVAWNHKLGQQLLELRSQAYLPLPPAAPFNLPCPPLFPPSTTLLLK